VRTFEATGDVVERATYVRAMRGALVLGRATFTLRPIPGAAEKFERGDLPQAARLRAWQTDLASLGQTPPQRPIPFLPRPQRGGWMDFAWETDAALHEAPVDGELRNFEGVPATVWTRTSTLTVPWWFLTLLFAVAPAVALRRRWRVRRRRRLVAGLCPACGYDCRATPDRCPECGTVRTTAAAAAAAATRGEG
jgi:hypothetical protein